MATRASKTKVPMVNQVLDDMVVCGADGNGTVRQFNNKYREICNKVGISLADESDPDKAFDATHKGKVLGIMYDLKKWIWWLSEDKLIPIINLLTRVSEGATITNGQMMTLNGKLNHPMRLVPEGC